MQAVGRMEIRKRVQRTSVTVTPAAVTFFLWSQKGPSCTENLQILWQLATVTLLPNPQQCHCNLSSLLQRSTCACAALCRAPRDFRAVYGTGGAHQTCFHILVKICPQSAQGSSSSVTLVPFCLKCPTHARGNNAEENVTRLTTTYKSAMPN